jgi:foldase protein PrsA
MAPLLTGCRVGDKEVKLEANQLSNRRTVLKINNEKCDIRMARLYLCNYRNLYGSAYGLKLWETENYDLMTYVKDVTIQELSYIICMDLLAKEQDMSLDDEEEALVQDAAEEYYGSLTEEECAFMGVTERDIRSAYADYALAQKLYKTLTVGVDEEVSDDEARVVQVQQIVVQDEATADEIAKKLDAGSDFLSVASAYQQGTDSEKMVARGDYPQEVENIVFNLDDGETSERIDTEDGYYFVKCLNRFDEELTEQNKEIIRQNRQKEQFENSYQQFVDAATFQMNDTLWDEVTLDGTENIVTDSFFAVYDTYFSQIEDEE